MSFSYFLLYDILFYTFLCLLSIKKHIFNKIKDLYFSYFFFKAYNI